MIETPAMIPAVDPGQWAALLEPVPGDDPCGVSLRYEGAYDQVRRYRQADDETLAQGVWETAPRRADWNAVAAVCAHALAHSTKDLQLAAWLLEAWIRLHGFEGAAAGLALIEGLCARYWSGLHPRPEDGDLEFRYSVVRWMDDKLSTDLKLVAVTAPPPGETPARTWADHETLQRAARRGADAAPDETAADRALFQKSLSLTPAEWLAEQRRHALDVIEHSVRIGHVLDESGRGDAPGLVRLRQVAQAVADYLGVALGKRRPAVVEARSEAAPAPATPPRPESAPAVAMGAEGGIQSRRQAYDLLSSVADYLEATEPHSPVPHLVRRAVRWGELSLAELLPELIRDTGHLDEIQRLLHIGGGGASGPPSRH